MNDDHDVLEVRELIVDNSMIIGYTSHIKFCSIGVDALSNHQFIGSSFGLSGIFMARNDATGPTLGFQPGGTNIDDINQDYAVLALATVGGTQGFLPPRMTAAEKGGITNTQGLLVYSTDGAKLCINTGAGWETITSV